MADTRKPSPKKATRKTPRSPAEWRISGVSKRTQDAVARAAKKDEIPVGKWVDRTLREAAEMRLKGAPPSLVLPPELLDTLSDLSRNVEELNNRRSFGAQTLQQVQEVASDLSEQVSSAYDSLAKRADPAIDEVRSKTKETFEEAAKWRDGVAERLRNAAGGIERLQQLVTRQGSDPKAKPAAKRAKRAPSRRRQPAKTGATKPSSK